MPSIETRTIGSVNVHSGRDHLSETGIQSLGGRRLRGIEGVE